MCYLCQHWQLSAERRLQTIANRYLELSRKKYESGGGSQPVHCGESNNYDKTFSALVSTVQATVLKFEFCLSRHQEILKALDALPQKALDWTSRHVHLPKNVSKRASKWSRNTYKHLTHGTIVVCIVLIPDYQSLFTPHPATYLHIPPYTYLVPNSLPERTFLPTCLPSYNPTIYPLPGYLRMHLPTYVPTYLLTLSLLRVINVKFPLQPHQNY